MLTFVAPIWIWAAGAVALAGAIALWRGRKNRVLVSSTKLWAEISKKAAGAKKRMADPLWILIWLSALLAGIAAARPGWASGSPPAEMKVEVEARALRGSADAEIFVRCAGDVVPDAMEIVAKEKRERVVLDPSKIKNGIVTKIPNAASLTVEFFAGGKKIAVRELIPVTKRPIKVETIGRVPEALRRVFAVMNSGDTNDQEPIRVLLVGDSPAGWQGEVPLDLDRRLSNIVIYTGAYVPGEPNAAWKEFSPPAKVESAGTSALTVDDGVPIEFGGTVKRMRVIKVPTGDLSQSPQVILKAGDLPLVVIQKTAQGYQIFVQLAVTLSPADTDWPLDVSFPIFFSKLVETARWPGETAVSTWRVSQPKDAQSAASLVPFAPWLVFAAIALVTAASAGLVRRGLRPK